MSVIEKIENIIKYRENISDIIRSKGIDIPENTKLKEIPNYMVDLIKREREIVQKEWSEEFYTQCVNDSLLNYLFDRNKYTGHVDVAGLRDIGWTEDDINYFQENGVDWMEEDDEQYVVSSYEKEIYSSNAIRISDIKVDGVTIKATYTNTLLTNNDQQIIEWRNNIRWMPKFTTEIMPTSISFRNFSNMIGCPSFDFSKTTNPSYLFSKCYELRCVPQISFAVATTSNWNGMYLFYECNKLKTIPSTINWNMCNNVQYTFGDCNGLLYLPEMDLSNVSNMNNTFTNCKNLITISQITTSNKLTNASNAFSGCRSMLTPPLFNTSNCTIMNNMFSNCQTMVNIPSYNTSKNTTFATFFRNCSSLLSCPNLNFDGGVTTYDSMFIGCEKLEELPTTMNFSKCVNISNMCNRCLKLSHFPYKLNLNYYATSAEEGIKNHVSCFYFCVNLKKIDIGLYKSNATTFISECVFLDELNVDNFDGGTNLLGCDTLFNITKIGGQLKGMTKSFSISAMRKLPREMLLKVFNSLEDISESSSQKITIGAESLRNLTIDDKIIATNKGWILA